MIEQGFVQQSLGYDFELSRKNYAGQNKASVGAGPVHSGGANGAPCGRAGQGLTLDSFKARHQFGGRLCGRCIASK
jgi:hypothetical protein